MWSNKSVAETYEPGSVFKVITASVALEENITTTDKSNDFYCKGYEEFEDSSASQPLKFHVESKSSWCSKLKASVM